ncbi:MAG: arginase family protein, partial [Rikenellaceae bacterium]
SASTDRVEMFDDRQIAKSIFEGDNWSQICDRIVSRLPERFYISLDIDGLEMGCCPNSGTPVPGGLSFNQVVYLLETLTQSSRQIIGFDIVEVAPNPAQRIDAIVGARMLYKLASQTLLSNKNK